MTTVYNEEKQKFDVEIPLAIQAWIFKELTEFDPVKMVNTQSSEIKELKYVGTGKHFSFSIKSDSFVKNGIKHTSFYITIENKQINMIYEIEFILMKSGRDIGYKTFGYSEEKLHFLDELFGKYVSIVQKQY